MAQNKFLKTFLLLNLFCITTSLFAFDWPQDEVESDSFYSYFGQLRGGTIESSLVFKNSSIVKAAEKGTVMAIITEHDDDFGWFESTLGNAVLISHDNNIVTVYGNLDEDTLSKELTDIQEIETGTILGESGNSGWQEGQSCLEFQVLDTQNSSVINPRILMPRAGNELPLVIGELTLDNKSGITYNLSIQKSLKSGEYCLYRNRQKVAVPYKTEISINGALTEKISYDMLKKVDRQLCILGNSHYAKNILYPDNERQLLGKIILTRGRNTLSVVITDILGAKKTINYTIEVY